MPEERSGRRGWWPVRRSGQATGDERERWHAWAREIVASEDEWMILDLETTGSGRAMDIIEIAAVSPGGKTLIDYLVRPATSIPPWIVELTGISDAMVADAPRFAALYSALRPVLAARNILVYNVGFDIPMLRQNIQRYCGEVWEPRRAECLMRAYAKYRGERYPTGHRQAGQVRVHKLGVACGQMGISNGNAHRALGDCQVSAALLRAMAQRR